MCITLPSFHRYADVQIPSSYTLGILSTEQSPAFLKSTPYSNSC